MSNSGTAGGGGVKNINYEIYQLLKKAVGDSEADIKKQIEGYTTPSGNANANGASGTANGGGNSLSTQDTIAIQYKVGEYNNLVQQCTGIIKSMKDAIGAGIRYIGQ